MNTEINKEKRGNNNKLLLLVVPKKKTLCTRSKQWHQHKLTLTRLATLTPPEYDVEIVDENESETTYDKKADLVDINFESYSCCRAYKIADKYRKLGVSVILSGLHASHFPAEAQKHADAVVIGDVEGVWSNLLSDFNDGNLKSFYRSTS